MVNPSHELTILTKSNAPVTWSNPSRNFNHWISEATDYAVQLRYDIEFWPEKETAVQAQALAQQVVDIITIALDLRATRRYIPE
jgi:hypothetical protein